ncbi:MAG: hypothetical protein HY587_02230 [Candidatus Omnitrophica bacterium]|nr:hypothetical protein [Candidatus Omnitrophota bacterium]
MVKSEQKNPQVIFLVERGWRGARELAIKLARQHLTCWLIIKGKVPSDVLEIITPRAGISVRSLSRWYFKPMVALLVIWHRLFGCLKCVIVNKDRTLFWMSAIVRMVGCHTVLLNEVGESIELSNYQHQTIRPEDLASFLSRENSSVL